MEECTGNMRHLKGFNWTLVVIMLVLCTMILPILPASVVMASNVTGASFYGLVLVSNNGASSANTVYTTGNWSTQNLIDGSFVTSNASNIVIRNTSGSDVAFMPGIGSANWSLYVPDIGADSYMSYILYVGDVSEGKYRYFPNAAGMYTADSPTIELSDNFSISQSGFVDTDSGSSKNMVSKLDAYKTYISASEEITSGILPDWASSVTQDLRDQALLLYNGSPNFRGGQRINSFPVGTISQVSFYLQKLGNPPGSFDVRARKVSDDSIIGTFGTMSADSLTTSWAWYDFTTDVDITTSQDIRICVEYIGLGDVANRVEVGWKNSDETSYGLYTWYTGAWNDNAAADATFKYEADITPLSDVTITGISSGEETITTVASANVPAWATGNVLDMDYNDATSNINCGAIYNAAPKLWGSFWFKPSVNYSGGHREYLTVKFVDATHYIYIYLNTADGKLHYEVIDGANTWNLSVGSGTFLATTWYHVLWSLSDAAGARLRLDNGAAQTSAVICPAPNGGNFNIGNFPNIQGFNGEIMNYITGTDDLTLGEETDLYNGTAPGDEVDYWYIDEGTGSTIYSYGSGANNGTAGGGTSWGTETYTTGNTGRLCDFYITDGTDRIGTNLKGVSVPDNNNDIYFLQNYSMPYMEAQNIWVGGVLQQSIDWEYDTTFTDSSGNSHDATPSFRTMSSNSNVWAYLAHFLPISEAISGGYTLGDAPDFITTAPNITGGFNPTVNPTIPGADVVTAIASAGSTPSQLPFFFISGFVIIVFSLLISWIMKRQGSNNLWIKVMVIMALMGFAIGVSLYDLWMIVMFGIIVIAIMMASRQPTWG